MCAFDVKFQKMSLTSEWMQQLEGKQPLCEVEGNQCSSQQSVFSLMFLLFSEESTSRDIFLQRPFIQSTHTVPSTHRWRAS